MSARRYTWLLVASLATGCFDPDHGADLVPAGTDGATGEVAEAGESGEDAAEVCADYCSLIGDHCQGDDAQYDGDIICESTCENMPLGEVGDELGHSATCRTFHAVLAAEVPQTHCPHAGPAGDGTCGADCESFCAMAQSVCGSELSPFSGTEDCLSACEDYPAEPAYSANVPDGDSFACRLRHLTLASLQPDLHCSHIGRDSPVCQ